MPEALGTRIHLEKPRNLARIVGIATVVVGAACVPGVPGVLTTTPPMWVAALAPNLVVTFLGIGMAVFISDILFSTFRKARKKDVVTQFMLGLLNDLPVYMDGVATKSLGSYQNASPYIRLLGDAKPIKEVLARDAAHKIRAEVERTFPLYRGKLQLTHVQCKDGAMLFSAVLDPHEIIIVYHVGVACANLCGSVDGQPPDAKSKEEMAEEIDFTVAQSFLSLCLAMQQLATWLPTADVIRKAQLREIEKITTLKPPPSPYD